MRLSDRAQRVPGSSREQERQERGRAQPRERTDGSAEAMADLDVFWRTIRLSPLGVQSCSAAGGVNGCWQCIHSSLDPGLLLSWHYNPEHYPCFSNSLLPDSEPSTRQSQTATFPLPLVMTSKKRHARNGLPVLPLPPGLKRRHLASLSAKLTQPARAEVASQLRLCP